VDPGFDGRNVLTMQINLPGNPYRDRARAAAFQQQLVERMNALPGVESTSLSMALPPNLLVMRNPFTVEGQPRDPQPVAQHLLVSPAYFETLGIRLLEGRVFTDADNLGAPQTMIIGKTMAQQFFPGESAVGKKIQTGDFSARVPYITIVGVVDDVKYTGLDEDANLTLYTPYLQNLWWRTPYLAVRTSRDPVAMTSAIRSVIWELDRDLPVSSIRTGDELLADSVAQPRAYTVLLGVFGGVALLLATVGIYGVMSYVVKQRRREIGIRLAMGAQRGDVLKLVVRQGMTLALIGIAIGLGGAFALTRLLASLLFGVRPADLLTFAAVSAVLTGVALLACFIPARRASRVDPMVALRCE
jgi:putative ABC transport system permease protein